jgi:hypothetical protein
MSDIGKPVIVNIPKRKSRLLDAEPGLDPPVAVGSRANQV